VFVPTVGQARVDEVARRVGEASLVLYHVLLDLQD
jgi:hypothetical protein